MNNIVCIIGSNRGIGLALVIEYLSYGWTVYGVCRTPSQDLSDCLLYTSPSPRDRTRSRMPSSA